MGRRITVRLTRDVLLVDLKRITRSNSVLRVASEVLTEDTGSFRCVVEKMPGIPEHKGHDATEASSKPTAGACRVSYLPTCNSIQLTLTCYPMEN